MSWCGLGKTHPPLKRGDGGSAFDGRVVRAKKVRSEGRIRCLLPGPRLSLSLSLLCVAHRVVVWPQRATTPNGSPICQPAPDYGLLIASLHTPRPTRFCFRAFRTSLMIRRTRDAVPTTKRYEYYRDLPDAMRISTLRGPQPRGNREEIQHSRGKMGTVSNSSTMITTKKVGYLRPTQ